MDAFFTSSGLIALITLTILEIVLGVDNVIPLKFEAGINDNKFEAERDFRKLAEAACARLNTKATTHP